MPNIMPFTEIGQPGYLHSGGFVEDDFLWQLRGQKGAKIYREMCSNSAIINASMRVLKQTLQSLTYESTPCDPEDKTAQDYSTYVNEAIADMSHSWEDGLSGELSFLKYGYAPCEIVYKRREGWNESPGKRSKYNDGKIGWRKIALRAQTTIVRWEISEDGSILGVWQQNPNSGQEVLIPIEKLLLFRLPSDSGSPEGDSLLRGCYFDWYFYKKLTEITMVGAERDLTGLVKGRYPAEADSTAQASFRKLLENLRAHEQAMIKLPSARDESGAYVWDVELMASPGSKQVDTQRMIERHELRMALVMLTDVILLGHEKVGSRALGTTKTDILAIALSSIADMVCDIWTRHAIPRLGALNGWKMDLLPYLTHSKIATPDVEALATLLDSLSKAGVDVFPDEDLTRHVYQMAGLPTSGRDKLMEEEMMRPKQPEPPKPPDPDEDEEDGEEGEGDADAEGDEPEEYDEE